MVSPQWQDKASGFFQSSGVKLKEAGNSAGIFVGGVTKDAKGNVAEVAEKVGTAVKSRWAVFQQPSTRQAMRENLLSAAATTTMFLRKGLSETKDKVVVGKTKVEEVAKKTAQKSKTLLTDIERWQKGVASTDGLNSQELFNAEGDRRVLRQLVSLYNQDPNASLPEGVNPIDVAALTKCYLASLPEPLITFDLHNDVRNARSNVSLLGNVLKRLTTVNYMTLEMVTALLLRVSQKSLLNKVDARSLAMEMAPIIMWQKGRRPELYKLFWSDPTKLQFKKNTSFADSFSAHDILSDEDESHEISSLSSSIPLDDGIPLDYFAVEAIQCLIEHHNAVFTDANETVWR